MIITDKEILVVTTRYDNKPVGIQVPYTKKLIARKDGYDALIFEEYPFDYYEAPLSKVDKLLNGVEINHYKLRVEEG